MPYQTIWEPHGVYWKFYGAVTMAEVTEANEAFYVDPRSDSAMYQIFDGLEMTDLYADERDLKLLAAKDKGSSISIPNIRCVIVVDTPEMIALAEVYADTTIKLNSTWSVKIVPTVQEGRAWLKEVDQLSEVHP